MENPATWGQAEKIVSRVYQDWWKAREEGVIGTSLPRRVVLALREAGQLRPEHGLGLVTPGRPIATCWICSRTIPRDEAAFVVIEDDGCGEYECASRRDCYLTREGLSLA